MSFAKGVEEKKVSWEKYLLTVIFTFGAFFVGMLAATQLLQLTGVMDATKSSLRFALNLLPFLFGFVGLLLSIKFLLNRRILSIFTSRQKFDWQRFFFAFRLWFGFQLVFLLIGKASGLPISFDLSIGNFLPLLLVSITLLPIQTAFEDVFYRGFLFQALSRVTGKAIIALVAIALLFGWMHSGNPEVAIFGSYALVYYCVSGLFLGLLAHFDDGLELGMGYHFANNFFGAVMLTNTWQVFQSHALFTDHSPPQFGWEMWIPLAVLQPAMLYAFYRVYRWKNPLKRILE
jgi:membrane protease YdiL (CAAX protease family)